MGVKTPPPLSSRMRGPIFSLTVGRTVREPPFPHIPAKSGIQNSPRKGISRPTTYPRAGTPPLPPCWDGGENSPLRCPRECGDPSLRMGGSPPHMSSRTHPDTIGKGVVPGILRSHEIIQNDDRQVCNASKVAIVRDKKAALAKVPHERVRFQSRQGAEASGLLPKWPSGWNQADVACGAKLHDKGRIAFSHRFDQGLQDHQFTANNRTSSSCSHRGSSAPSTLSRIYVPVCREIQLSQQDRSSLI